MSSQNFAKEQSPGHEPLGNRASWDGPSPDRSDFQPIHGMTVGDRTARVAANLEVLESLGFRPCGPRMLSHPDHDCPIVPPMRVDYGLVPIAGFIHRSRRPDGVPQILNPEWIHKRDVDAVLRNLQAILAEDFAPVIECDLVATDPEFIRPLLIHELSHFYDSLSEEGQMRLAVQLCNAELDLQHVAISLAYDTWTEMRAHAADGSGDSLSNSARQVVDSLTTFLADRDFAEQHRHALCSNAHAFIEQLWPTFSHHYGQAAGFDIAPPLFSVPEIACHVPQAAECLTDLMLRRGVPLFDRL